MEVRKKPGQWQSGWYSIEVENLIRSPQRRFSSRPHVWRPPTDVYETEVAVIVRVEIAGMRDVKISVLLDNQMLIVQGMRSDKTERLSFHQMEIQFGEFSSEVELPYSIDKENIEAEYQDGFLTIVLRKSGPKRLQIRE